MAEEFGGTSTVLLMVSSEKTKYMGEAMNVKTYLGNLAVNAFEDWGVALPNYAQPRRGFPTKRRVARIRATLETQCK